MTEKPLSSGGPIRSFKIEIMNHGKRLQGFIRKATTGMVELGKIAIAPLNCGRSALIFGAEFLTPVDPSLQFGSFQLQGQRLVQE